MKENRKRESKLGIQEKKPLINPKYKNFLSTAIFLAVIAVFFIVNNSNSEPDQGPYPPGYEDAGTATTNPLVNKPAPDFELNSVENKTIKLSDYKGKVVLVDFWATWCPPCRKSIPDLINLKEKFNERGFEIIGISLDQQNTIREVAPFAKSYKINYPVVYADMNVWMNYGQIQSIPTSFLIDKEGKVVASYNGYVPEQIYVQEIQKLL